MRHGLRRVIASIVVGISIALGLSPATGLAQEQVHEHDGVLYTTWSDTSSLPVEPGSYYLTDNVTLSDTWTVPAGTTTICLNDKSIVAGTDEGEPFDAIVVPQGSVLALVECQKAGTLKGSAAKTSGHAVVVEAGGIFAMRGGHVTGFKQTAVQVNGGTFDLSGGEISGNVASAQAQGAGVFVSATGTLNVKGAPRVISNKAGETQSNVFLESAGAQTGTAASGAIAAQAASGSQQTTPAMLNVVGKLSEGARLGITRLVGKSDVGTAPFTKGYKDHDNTAEPDAFFASDVAGHAVAFTENKGEARFVKGYDVRIASVINNGSLTTSLSVAAAGKTVAITVTPASGYALERLAVVDANNKEVSVTNNTFVMPASDVTVSAAFKEAPKSGGSSSSTGPKTRGSGSSTDKTSGTERSRLAPTSDAATAGATTLASVGAVCAGAGMCATHRRRRMA